jgi:hypothetical protein
MKSIDAKSAAGKREPVTSFAIKRRISKAKRERSLTYPGGWSQTA